MTLETFFEKFDLFADAPDAVAKMRELVLEFAVRGKLVDQNPEDGPAKDLLRRLIEFKIANPLIGRSGRSKESTPDMEVGDAKIGALPLNWVNTTIGEVLYVIRGASPRPKGDPQYFSEARTPYHWVKISDIRKHGQNGLLMDTDEFLTESGMKKSVLLPKGTLVLTNSATIGIPIVLGIEGCCIHDGYLAFPNFPHELLSQKFLLYLFHTLKKHAEQNARGLAQLNLNTELVRSFPFGLPPLAEQKRIVAKVDELMALCDRLETQQKERQERHAALSRAALSRFAEAPTPANLTYLFHPAYDIPPADLRKAILSLAVQGKLVPQAPSDEPARISNAAQSVEESEWTARFGLPETWLWLRFDSLLFVLKNGFNGPPSKVVGKFKITRIETIAREKIDMMRVGYADELPIGVAEKHAVKKGDILFSHINSEPHLGKTAICTVEDPTLIHGVNLLLLRTIPEIDPGYLNLAIKELRAVGYFVSIAQRAVNQSSINQKNLGKTPIPVPPLAEQRRIVAKVAELMASVDTLETQLTDARTTATTLLDVAVDKLVSPKG